MGIFRVQKTDNYTVMSNYHFKDKRLSWKAKGMLSTFLSLPNDWDYKIHGLAQMSNDGESSVRAGLKELEDCGYLKRNPLKDNGRIIDWEYIIYEIPKSIENSECVPLVDFPQLEKPQLENQTQLNTNKLNTKELNNSANDFAPDEDTLRKMQDRVKRVNEIDKLGEDFEKLWNIYPSKKGKAKAFSSYCNWIKGKKYMNKTIKLTNAQMWYAIKKYAKECETNNRYFQNGSTFFNNTIIEYVEND